VNGVIMRLLRKKIKLAIIGFCVVVAPIVWIFSVQLFQDALRKYKTTETVFAEECEELFSMSWHANQIKPNFFTEIHGTNNVFFKQVKVNNFFKRTDVLNLFFDN